MDNPNNILISKIDIDEYFSSEEVKRSLYTRDNYDKISAVIPKDNGYVVIFDKIIELYFPTIRNSLFLNFDDLTKIIGLVGTKWGSYSFKSNVKYVVSFNEGILFIYPSIVSKNCMRFIKTELEKIVNGIDCESEW